MKVEAAAVAPMPYFCAAVAVCPPRLEALIHVFPALFLVQAQMCQYSQHLLLLCCQFQPPLLLLGKCNSMDPGQVSSVTIGWTKEIH
jgi:hypothetical protein